MASTTHLFKNVKIIWKNFSGKVNDFNAPVGVNSKGEKIGKRYFSIVLSEEEAEELRKIELRGKSGKMYTGAHIKTNLPKNGDGEPMYTLKVTFGAIPPQEVWRVVPAGRMELNLDNVDNLDHEFIDHATVLVTFSTYENGPNCGITAYLTKLAAYIKEDEFSSDSAFAGIPIIGGAGYSEPVESNDEDDLPF